jgi:hypothetical protein
MSAILAWLKLQMNKNRETDQTYEDEECLCQNIFGGGGEEGGERGGKRVFAKMFNQNCSKNSNLQGENRECRLQVDIPVQKKGSNRKAQYLT